MYEIFYDVLSYDVLSEDILYKYIFEVIFTGLLFDILGVKKVYALIPFYNIYRLYKEYKGRVWLTIRCNICYSINCLFINCTSIWIYDLSSYYDDDGIFTSSVYTYRERSKRCTFSDSVLAYIKK